MVTCSLCVGAGSKKHNGWQGAATAQEVTGPEHPGHRGALCSVAQIFHTMYHTDENVLLGAPTGSGKTISSELAILRNFNAHPGRKIIYIAPLKVCLVCTQA